MSLVCINNFLPTELLVEVFGYLETISTRCTASAVCRRWSEIMSNFGLVPVELHSEDLVEENFPQLKRLRAVATKRRYSLRNDSLEYARRLETYFYRTELVERLSELDITVSDELWETIFRKESELHLPNLKQIRIRDSYLERTTEMRCRIVAPKLQSFYQDGDLVDGPLRILNDQITELVARYRNKTPFLAMVNSVTFGKVRSLNLAVTRGSSLRAEDFSIQLEELFGRLDHLIIVDWGSTLSPVYSSIIEAAKHLKSFKLYGKKMSKYAFLQLNGLRQLTDLTLMIDFRWEGIGIKLSLPKLNNFKIHYCNSVLASPLTHVPKLKSVAIEHDPHLNDFFFMGLTRFVDSIAWQLETVELCNVLLAEDKDDDDDEGEFKMMYSLVNLLSLKLKNVEAEFSFVEKMFQHTKKLRFARFENCILAQSITYCNGGPHCDCDLCDHDNWNDEREVPIEEKYENFFEKLAQQYRDCEFAVQGGRCVSRWRSQAYSFYGKNYEC